MTRIEFLKLILLAPFIRLFGKQEPEVTSGYIATWEIVKNNTVQYTIVDGTTLGFDNDGHCVTYSN